MHIVTFLLTILTIFSECVFGAKILAFTPVASYSHHIWNRVILIELAKRGHNVIYYGADSEKTPTTNLSHVLLQDVYEKLHSAFDFETMTTDGPIEVNEMVLKWLEIQCEVLLSSKEIADLESQPAGTYDIILVDVVGAECLYPVMEKLGSPPIIMISIMGLFPLTSFIAGGYEYSAFVPHFSGYELTDQMTFLQRVENTLLSLYFMTRRKYMSLPKIEKMMNERYGDHTPVEVSEKNVSIVLANSDPILDWPRPFMPNVISVAGLHIQPPKPLPQNIKKFLDEATDGAIIFSFGTNMRSDSMESKKLKAVVDALGRIPQRVLWKWESDTLPGKPANVMIQKWIPQGDTLAHKNVQAIITHGGALSTQEAIARGIPMIIVPFFGDQHSNAVRLAHRKHGILLRYNELTADILENAIKEVIQNPIYRNSVKQASAQFNNQPQTPLERAIFWIEHVLRHGQPKHLRSEAIYMPFYQTYLIDVACFLLFIIYLIYKLISMSFCFVCKLCFGRTKFKVE